MIMELTHADTFCNVNLQIPIMVTPHNNDELETVEAQS